MEIAKANLDSAMQHGPHFYEAFYNAGTPTSRESVEMGVGGGAIVY